MVKAYAPRHLEDDNDRDDGLVYRELVHRYLIDLSCQATASSKAAEDRQEPGPASPLSGVKLPKGIVLDSTPSVTTGRNNPRPPARPVTLWLRQRRDADYPEARPSEPCSTLIILPGMSRPLFETGLAKAKAKSLLDKWPTAKALAYVADDARWGLRQRLGRIQSESGSTHYAIPIEQSVNYLEEVFNDYRTYGAFDHLDGAAAEVGPGDNAGIALLLQSAGCKTVDLVDRFRSRRNVDQQRRIYQALAARRGIQVAWGEVGWADECLPGISWRIGSSAEAYFAQRAHEGTLGYDLIVSRAALEHLYDPLGAIRSMAACLRPGGRMVHKVDFRDHGMFTPAHSELTFLRFPGPLHRQMTRRSGRPNRVLLHRYRDLATELGRAGSLEVTILVTSLVGEGEIVPHVPFTTLQSPARRRAVARVEAERHRFAREFDKVTSEDLAVTGIFWIGVRPPG